MKISVSKTYTLEGLSEDDLKKILKGLKYLDDASELIKDVSLILGQPLTVQSNPDSTSVIKNHLKINSSSITPYELFPNLWENYVFSFFIGKQGQLGISLWESKANFENAKPPHRKGYFNNYCAKLIADIITGKYHPYVFQDQEKRWTHTYLDRFGKKTPDKRFFASYHEQERALVIVKDDVEFRLFSEEVECLKELIQGA